MLISNKNFVSEVHFISAHTKQELKTSASVLHVFNICF